MSLAKVFGHFLVLLMGSTFSYSVELPPIADVPLQPPWLFPIPLTPTIYYKPTLRINERQCIVEDRVTMRSPSGKDLVTLCQQDFSQCLMQGSCFVIGEDKRLRSYNFHSRGPKGEPLFIEVSLKRCPYGFGVGNTCLDPYYSVAADLRVYKLGDVIFIPRLRGVTMPDGITHDGFVIVRDAGGKITGWTRFDFFTGFFGPASRKNTLARIGFDDPRNQFAFRMANDDEAEEVRRKRNYPNVPQVIIVKPLRRDGLDERPSH